MCKPSQRSLPQNDVNPVSFMVVVMVVLVCVYVCVCGGGGGWLTIHKICNGYPIKASTTRCVSISHLMTLLYITELQPILFVDCIVAIILHKSA